MREFLCLIPLISGASRASHWDVVSIIDVVTCPIGNLTRDRKVPPLEQFSDAIFQHEHVAFSNPFQIDAASFSSLAASLDITIPPQDVDTFRIVLDSADMCAKQVMGMDGEDLSKAAQSYCYIRGQLLTTEDYVPILDSELYPRSVLAIDESEGEPWAAKTSVQSTRPTSDLLKGRTIVLKDNIALANIPVQNGGVANWIPAFDATVVTRILDKGGVIVGKAVCEAACLSVVSDTASAGPVHNPFADGYSAGGSSSGCARLVAMDLADMAIGTDQGGSIRIPAAACGLVGLKPTWGLVPYTGIIGLSGNIDHVGPMCKTALDCAALLEAIAGSDGIDDRQSSSSITMQYHASLVSHLKNSPKAELLHGLKIGVLEDGFHDPSQNTEVEKCVREAIIQFEILGATVKSVSTPLHRESALVWMCMFPLLAVSQGMELNGIGRKGLALTDLWSETGARVSQETFEKMGYGGQNMLLRGAFLREKYGPSLAGRCINQLRKLNDEYDMLLRDVDVLVMPTTPALPGKIFHSSQHGSLLDRLSRTAGITSNTAPFNSSGHPAISFPVGLVVGPNSESPKLPVGMQVVGRKYEDHICLKVAASWELVSNWKEL